MSYCIQSNPFVSVRRNMTPTGNITNTKARGNGPGRGPRGNAQTKDTGPSLIKGIARELAKIEGGRIVDHLTVARQLLEDAFRAVEQTNGLAALREASPNAA